MSKKANISNTAFTPSLPLVSTTKFLPHYYTPSLRTTYNNKPTKIQTARRHRTWICQHTTPNPSMPPNSSPNPHKPPGRSSDYYTNIGAAIDTMRLDYPALLEHEPDLEYFHRDVIFSDSAGGRIHGKEAYRLLLWVLRAQMKCLFADAAIEIQSMFHDDSAGELYVRWRLSAAPRAWAIATRATPTPTVLDGMSVYRFDNNGIIIEHQLESVARRRGNAGVRVMFEEVLAVGTVRVKGVRTPRVPVGGVPTWFKTVFEHAEFTGLPEEDLVNENQVEELEEDGVNEQECVTGLMS